MLPCRAFRNEVQYGGQGILVFDIDHGHRFVKRIAWSGKDAQGNVLAVKGICASAVTSRLYVSTTVDLTCLDLNTDQILWRKPYDGGCDRMAITPDGKTIYLPALEGPHWNVVDAGTGEVLTKIIPKSGSHNTICSIDGKHVYLAGLKSRLLTIADTATNTAEKTVGPFGGNIRPFTVNGKGTLGFMCVNDLLGFEVADLNAGKVIYRVAIEGSPNRPHQTPRLPIPWHRPDAR